MNACQLPTAPIVCLMLLISSSLGCGRTKEPSDDQRAVRETVAPDEADRFRQSRLQMVEQQLQTPALAPPIQDQRVLEAMRSVPRHRFVPLEVRDEAYMNSPLPIGYGQTISQPYIVAFMTEQLRPAATDRVLEVGTGSGYQAAVLAELVDQVYSIEIVEPLAERARATLETLGYENVHVRSGDGYEGWPDQAPFDKIMVTCAPDDVPTPLVDQLKDGGRMMIPVGERFGPQELYLLEKHEGRLVQQSVLPVRFVPMTRRSPPMDDRP